MENERPPLAEWKLAPDCEPDPEEGSRDPAWRAAWRIGRYLSSPERVIIVKDIGKFAAIIKEETGASASKPVSSEHGTTTTLDNGQASSHSSESASVDWTVEAERVVMESADSVARRTNGTWINTRSETLIADVAALALRAYQAGEKSKNQG